MVYLTGGGPGTFAHLRRHFRAALRALPVKKPLVAYVGSASSDRREFFEAIAGALAPAGARIELARTASPRASAATARKLLGDADLVFVSGGDVDHGMKVLEDRGLADDLRALAAAGKPMFGISAGSILLAREWVRFPGDDESRAEVFPCLGIAPLHVDAHSEEDDWSELRTLVRLLHERGDRAPVGHGLTKRGGVVVTPAKSGARVRAVGTAIPRFGVRGGNVVKRAPLAVARAAKR
jgi:peptidase E